MAKIKDFSQHGESAWIDKFIKTNNLDIPKLFVDIGAHDGITNSNARFFALQGWRAIYFEPNPITYSRLFKNTQGQDCEIYNLAISDKISKFKFEIVTRTNYEGHSKINGQGNHTVLGMPLSNFLNINDKIGILDIDAEGHDNVIAKSIIEKENLRPYIVILESNSDASLKEAQNIMSIHYKQVGKIKVNTIWCLKHLL